VTESSESVLAGTKRPPFRLVVHAVTATGERMPAIRPAVSEQFVVGTCSNNEVVELQYIALIPA
jgi:hypothetical protein